MFYLPDTIPNARVLITVKTYPRPSDKYDELVCTAGLLSDGKWVRIYPMPFRALPYPNQYKRYSWIELDLVRNWRDFRPESYRPRDSVNGVRVLTHIDTKDNWRERKEYVLREVFTSMEELINLAWSDSKKSLATLRPREIVDFVIQNDKRDWPLKMKLQLLQLNLFEQGAPRHGEIGRVVKKLPYKYSYKFLSEGDTKPRMAMIEDWEIGALYWNCLASCEGDETAANQLVRQKYFDEFVQKKDVYFFLGTTLRHHHVSRNPFIIIGTFHPMKVNGPQQPIERPQQLSLF